MQAPENVESPIKLAVIRIFLVLIMPMFAISCSDDPFLPSSEFADLPSQTKEILINNGRYDKPYETLGPIEYTLKTSTSTPVNQIGLRNRAIAILKQEALAKYSAKTDAIVDVKVVESIEESDEEKLNIIEVSGIAIAFIPEPKPVTKQKIKPKAKPSPNKTKPLKNGSGKTQTEDQDIEITPSELLK